LGPNQNIQIIRKDIQTSLIDKLYLVVGEMRFTNEGLLVARIPRIPETIISMKAKVRLKKESWKRYIERKRLKREAGGDHKSYRIVWWLIVLPSVIIGLIIYFILIAS